MELYKESKLVDESNGFDGETVFELDNGQKWKQVEYYYRYRYKYRPKVQIFRDGGRYLLKIEGIDKLVRVQQI